MTADPRVIQTAVALHRAGHDRRNIWGFASQRTKNVWILAAVAALDMSDRAVAEALRRQATAPMSRDLPAGEVIGGQKHGGH